MRVLFWWKNKITKKDNLKKEEACYLPSMRCFLGLSLSNPTANTNKTPLIYFLCNAFWAVIANPDKPHTKTTRIVNLLCNAFWVVIVNTDEPRQKMPAYYVPSLQCFLGCHYQCRQVTRKNTAYYLPVLQCFLGCHYQSRQATQKHHLLSTFSAMLFEVVI